MNKILLIYDDYSELTTVEFSLKKVGFDVVSISSEFSAQEKLLSFNPEIVIAYGRGPKVTTIGVGKRLKDMGRWGGKAILIFPAGMKPDPQDLIRTRMDLLLEAPVPTVRLIQILAKMTNQDDQVLVEKLIKAAATEATEGNANPLTQQKLKGDDTVFVGGLANPSVDSQLVGGKIDALAKNQPNEEPSFEMDLNVEKIGEDTSSTKGQQFVLSPEPQLMDPVESVEEEKTFSMGSSISSSEQSAASAATQFKKEVEEVKKSLAERTKKYFEFTKGLRLNPESSLQRSRVKLEQKKLSADWAPQENDEQDDLRRKFTKALFKK